MSHEAALGFAGVGALLWEVLTLNKLIEMILIRFGVAYEAVLRNVMSRETLRQNPNLLHASSLCLGSARHFMHA